MASLVTTPAASLVSELMFQGRQSAAVLEALLQDASPTKHAGIRDLAAEILRCCDRALAALHGGIVEDGAGGRKRKSGTAVQTRPKRRTRASGGEAAAAKRVEKKWTAEDGFMWRKYGQKVIHNSKHPRLYFRCTYKDDGGCPATRQVQLSEDEPSLYVITYFGDHTCCADVAAAPASGVNDEEKQPFVINFGSATARGGSSSDDGDGQSEASRSWQAVRSPEEDREELRAQVTKSEPVSLDLQPAAELSPCASPAWDPLAACSDWNCFDETSFDYVSDFLDSDGIDLYQ